MPADGKHNWYQSFERLVRYRLFVPLKRSKQPPEHSARGVAVGMFWAMTPFFGAQMALVFLTWGISKKLLRWDFALVPGLAWTWITNIFTLPPFFYAFYLTGQLVLGRIGSTGGYGTFIDAFDQATASAGEGVWNLLSAWMNVIISDIGFPLSVGSIIWSVVCAWGSYYLTLRFVNQYRARREGTDVNDVNSDINAVP